MRSFRNLFLPLVSLLLIAPAAAFAQRVYWEPGFGTLPFGEPTRLTLVFDDCMPSGRVTLPEVDGLTFGNSSYGTEQGIDNGVPFARVLVAFNVQGQRKGPVTIPAFDVATNKGKLAVGEARYDVGEPGAGSSNFKIGEFIESTLRPSRTTIWAGEVIDVEYTLSVSPRMTAQLAGNPEWKPAGFVLEPFGEGEPVEINVRGERRAARRYRARALALTPGQFSLDPVRQKVNVQTGERAGFLFSQPRFEEFPIESSRPEITVKALPSPAPAGFTGAVGDFKLESRVVPTTARVGEPLTWTLTLRGTGNWPSNLHLPQREISADFHVVQPQSKQTMDDGRLFTGSLSEDAVLVPTRPGNYRIGPISFTFFDTTKGAYRTETIDAVSAAIQTAPASATASSSPSATTDSSPAAGTATPENRAPPKLPGDLPANAGVPRDPIVDGRTAFAPFTLPVAWWFFAAFIPPLIAWLGLAWKQAIANDESRERRAAKRDLRKLLEPLAQTDATPGRSVLESWRALTAQLWRVPRAAPTMDDLAAALVATPGAPRAEIWVDLWREAEAVLFAPQSILQKDWVERALVAVREARVRRASPPIPVRARHWAPYASLFALVAFGLLTSHARAAGDPARAAYDAGHFSEAREIWLSRITTRPDDWVSHNNAALAHAQEAHWADAAAHWTAAFLLNPRDETVRANLRLALSHLDAIDPTVRRVVNGTWLDQAVGALAPGEWQAMTVTGATLVAIGGLLAVVALYRAQGRGLRTAGTWLVVLGVTATAAGLFATWHYGPLAQPTAALVTSATQLRSIPSDLAEKQQTTPLPAGAVVVVMKSFQLGWDQVLVGNSAKGWVRRETITPFFRAPPRRTRTAAEL